MNKLIQVRLSDPNYNTEEISSLIIELYSGILNKAHELGIWDESITAIVITDDLRGEVEKQAELWNVETKLSREKEFVTASKILFNHNLDNPERHIFFPFNNLLNADVQHEQIAIGQILSIKSRSLLPIGLRKQMLSTLPFTLEEHVKFASTDWCVANYTRNILSQLYPTPANLINHNSLLTAFKRKLKRSLYTYNSDVHNDAVRLNIFWHEFLESLDTLILRISESQDVLEELLIKVDEPCRDLLYGIIQEVNLLTVRYQEQKPYEVSDLKEAIKAFSAHFQVYLEKESDGNFYIRLTKNPKDYFVDEIVETEPRIVCFMDILGFSELINEYDSDITSTVLQDIQESFKLAKENLLDSNLNNDAEDIKHLKYQTFSDNICISIPYFDNEDDFLVNLNILITYVRGFQSIMMAKGFFTRGGISVGSYYADNNIIFSLGLVKAYHLESKKAIYPRVLLDNDIIKKLENYDSKKISDNGLNKVIIFDWENAAFLNPFNLLYTSLSQFESIFEDTKMDESDAFSKSVNSFLDITKEVTINSIKMASEHEKKLLEEIKNMVLDKIYLYKHNTGVVTKYTWLLEFIKWLEGDNTAKLNFEFLNERLN